MSSKTRFKRADFKGGVRRVIDQTGITLEEASVRSGHKRSWLSSICHRNNPTLSNICEVAKALDVDTEVLIHFTFNK